MKIAFFRRLGAISGGLAAITLGLLIAFCPWPAQAQLGAVPSSIVIDAATGTVLSANHPDEQRFPASLTKLMTLYLAFKALRDHRITLDQLVPVSAHAASVEPVKLWLVPGGRVTVQQCILGMVTLSANDAATALGELLGGTESRFAQMMNRQAQMLGMSRTIFRNASGLPNPAQVTTARDIATLARALIYEFPSDYHYFDVPRFVFNGRTIDVDDPMLGRYPGVDGMKTGFTSAAGFNLVTSAVRGGRRLIAVILGAPSDPIRDAEMVALLNNGFAETGSLVARNQPERGFHPTLISTADAAELPAAVPPPIVADARLATAAPAPRPGYTVQIGSYDSWSTALGAVRRTVATVGGVARIRRLVIRGRPVWQARVKSLTRADAARVCTIAEQRTGKCLILRPAAKMDIHPARPKMRYTVQVGSFASAGAARHAVNAVITREGGAPRIRPMVIDHKQLWQARVTSLTRVAASQTCPERLQQSRRCFILSRR